MEPEQARVGDGVDCWTVQVDEGQENAPPPQVVRNEAEIEIDDDI